MDQDKPTPISLNLDTLDAEGTPDPFVVLFGGHRYQFIGAEELDWRDIIAISSIEKTLDFDLFFDKALSRADAERMQAQKLSFKKLQALVEGYTKHFGMTTSPEADASL